MVGVSTWARQLVIIRSTNESSVSILLEIAFYGKIVGLIFQLLFEVFESVTNFLKDPSP